MSNLLTINPKEDDPMINEPYKFEPCRCQGADDDPISPLCGCGKNGCQARTFRGDTIHWRGEHWNLQCAFEATLSELNSSEQTHYTSENPPPRNLHNQTEPVPPSQTPKYPRDQTCPGPDQKSEAIEPQTFHGADSSQAQKHDPSATN